MNLGIKKITDLVNRLGSQALAASELGITQQYLSYILSGKRSISKKIAEKLGLRWELIDVSSQERV